MRVAKCDPQITRERRNEDRGVCAGDGDPVPEHCNGEWPAQRRQLVDLLPRHRSTGDDPLRRRHGLVEIVDAVEERAELEAAEHLAQL